MFTRTREQISNAVSLPAKNASLLSIVALVIAVVALIVSAAGRLS